MNWKWARRLVNFWPPLFFAGIKATSISEDFRRIEVVLKRLFHTRNMVGTQFGGSLFAMTDPWYMMMLTYNLGRDYFVWDKSAHIDFIAPGRTAVRAVFNLDDATLERIRAHTADGKKYLPNFAIDIVDDNGHLVARVHRTLYVRAKPHKRPQG
ncbi:DUF4442 domain-containing protein [Marinimicrobium sp. LS-A18]|uniref:DUF4442 domain-containing protein n=1 Tax=Marinimicrobium sp. LS-A18 TaxID=1381596 RepID=UPI000462FBA4|nr:DUF4442 domain-containing protein [Marinimicrobium sp. LS-A18]